MMNSTTGGRPDTMLNASLNTTNITLNSAYNFAATASIDSVLSSLARKSMACVPSAIHGRSTHWPVNLNHEKLRRSYTAQQHPVKAQFVL
jgi:hypothetical protein